MVATAGSTWTGTWRNGSGSISTQSNTIITVPYSYASQFEGASGANPEELLAAAHAGCFNQALANNFGMNDLEAESIDTTVSIDVHQRETGSPEILSSHISVIAKVPRCTQDLFKHCVERARLHCSISAVLNCEITMKAVLIEQSLS